MVKEQLIQDLKEIFGIETTNCYPKKSYLRDGMAHIGCYGSEIDKTFYFFNEFDKKYYVFKGNKENYDTENFMDKIKYQIPLAACEILEPIGEYKEKEDASFHGETTLRDLAAIFLKKPVSNKKWLNDIIKQC